ncbi:hypothetical protein [Cupriavidus pauculus]|uniref:hypothetical protein n=1 Tax=Cupriavidus pauculus TaxID=82633 RepID=UPI001EE17E96|nr:hypothetical protein [Cupriavidus pauculus]GJG96631.1 hypothetical protein CBA19C6_19100 [Cupriavidus pauculus]
MLDDIAPADTGEARLSWLRGDLRNHALRPRDTRLGNATSNGTPRHGWVRTTGCYTASTP